MTLIRFEELDFNILQQSREKSRTDIAEIGHF